MNKDHLAKLNEGAEAWNAWREEDKITEIDLSSAYLSKKYLRGIDFFGANLSGAELVEADLSQADLRGANLNKTNLIAADLVGANLNKADLNGADLSGTNLNEANLGEANLTGANLTDAILVGADLSLADLYMTNLSRADLNGAELIKANLRRTILIRAELNMVDFEGAIFAETVFGNTLLIDAIGLDICVHWGPSIIDHSTLEKSGSLPDVFLRGCGLPDLLIDYLPTLLNQPIQFYSCFISYSHADKKFATRLHDQLQGRGIRCWLDEHQLLPGDDIHEQVDLGIKLWDKVLLCCSEASLTSWWVDNEIETTFQKEQKLMKERKEKVLSLIPLNIDGHLFQWENGKAVQVKSRMAADFTGWEKDNDKFESAFERLVKALTTEDRGREPAPKSKL